MIILGNANLYINATNLFVISNTIELSWLKKLKKWGVRSNRDKIDVFRYQDKIRPVYRRCKHNFMICC